VEESRDPLGFIGYPRWDVFIRSFFLLDQINPHLWLNVVTSLFSLLNSSNLTPDPYKENNRGFTNFKSTIQRN
ncbi:MAG: hypothetical protein ACXWFB_10835, partial [Nitrososphaeraceae archaeon]